MYGITPFSPIYQSLNLYIRILVDTYGWIDLSTMQQGAWGLQSKRCNRRMSECLWWTSRVWHGVSCRARGRRSVRVIASELISGKLREETEPGRPSQSQTWHQNGRPQTWLTIDSSYNRIDNFDTSCLIKWMSEVKNWLGTGVPVVQWWIHQPRRH